jgi:hypothetical protein
MVISTPTSVFLLTAEVARARRITGSFTMAVQKAQLAGEQQKHNSLVPQLNNFFFFFESNFLFPF